MWSGEDNDLWFVHILSALLLSYSATTLSDRKNEIRHHGQIETEPVFVLGLM